MKTWITAVSAVVIGIFSGLVVGRWLGHHATWVPGFAREDPTSTIFWIERLDSKKYEAKERSGAVGVLSVRAKEEPEALAALLKALRDPDSDVRHATAVFLHNHDYLRGYIDRARSELKDVDDTAKKGG